MRAARTAGRLTGLLAALLIWSAAGWAQDGAKFEDLDDLLKAVENERLREQDKEARRLQEFIDKRDDQAALLDAIKTELDTIRTESAELEGRLDGLDQRLDQERTRFEREVGDYRAVFDLFAAEVGKARQEQTLFRTSRPARDGQLSDLIGRGQVPTSGNIRSLWQYELEAMTWEAFVGSYQTSVILQSDQMAERRVRHAGPFLAATGGRFLNIDDETGVLQELKRQPARGLRKVALTMEAAVPANLMAVAIDPSGEGAVLDLYVRLPTIAERIAQGRIVGLLIIVLLIAGVLLGLERLIRFWVTGRNMRLERKDGAQAPNNPLRRVVQVFEDDPAAPADVLERRLEEAVSRELPALERRTGVLKVMAAMATLLGLLGTVIGMIRTFESLALFGGGEPRLMASGISEALVTTMLGLMAAIPLLIIHGIVSARSQSLVNLLEHEAIGLVARRSERRAQVARGLGGQA